MPSPTKAQLRALEGVRNREVVLDRYGALAYDGKEISGSALAACRRRGWTYVARDLGPHGRISLTADGSDALDGRPLGTSGGEDVRRWTIRVCPICGKVPGANHRHGHDAVAVEVVPLSEVREALKEACLSDEAIKVAADAALEEAGDWGLTHAAQAKAAESICRVSAKVLLHALDAAFSSDSEEGQR